MLARRLRLNSGLTFDFAEGARVSPRRSTASQHKRHSFRPRHSAGTPDDQANRFNPSAMPDLRAAWTFNRIVDHPISSPLSIKYVGHAREWDSIELSGS